MQNQWTRVLQQALYSKVHDYCMEHWESSQYLTTQFDLDSGCYYVIKK